MQWHIGQPITPTDDVTYIIEESLDRVYLFEDRNSPSTLYKARELNTGVTVFIKCYDENLSTRPDYNRAYKNIIDRQHNILLKAKTERDNLGIFRIIDRFTYEYPYVENERRKESIYFVLEYHEGKTLGQKVEEARASQNNLDLENVLQYVEQVSSVLDYFHTKNLSLGLIVPSNIWITSSNEVFIINFDIVWDIRNHTGQSFLAERTDFCPLNRKVGEATKKTDIYSLGAVLYYTLTGIENTYLLTEESRSRTRLPLLSEYRNDIPKHIEDGIFRSIDLNSRNRFDSIHDFRKALGLLKQPLPDPVANSEEFVRLLINQTQTDVNKVLLKATDLGVERSPLEENLVKPFVTDMIRIIRYVDPAFSIHLGNNSYPEKPQSAKKVIKNLPFYYYFYFFSFALSIVLLPSYFIVPFQFPKNLPFLGFCVSTILMTLSTVWFSRRLLIGTFLLWLISSCLIISIASFWNFLYIFAIIIIITILFKVFKESFSDAYSSLDKAILDLQKKRSGYLSWDILAPFALGVVTAWILASIFGRAG